LNQPSTTKKETYLYQTKQNKTNQPNQPNQINHERRSNQSFHLFPSVADSFRKYAHRVPEKNVGEVIEEALFEYIENHPIEDVTLIIQRKLTEEIPDVSRRLEQKILIKDIRYCVYHMDNIRKTGKGDYDCFHEQLIGHLKNAIKIKNPNGELVKLMELIDNDGYLE